MCRHVIAYNPYIIEKTTLQHQFQADFYKNRYQVCSIFVFLANFWYKSSKRFAFKHSKIYILYIALVSQKKGIPLYLFLISKRFKQDEISNFISKRIIKQLLCSVYVSTFLYCTVLLFIYYYFLYTCGLTFSITIRCSLMLF